MIDAIERLDGYGLIITDFDLLDERMEDLIDVN